MDLTAAAALSSARTYLNDQGAQIWSDVLLIPYLQEAYKDLILVLALNGLPVIHKKTTSPLTIPIGKKSLVDASVLPADIIAPIWLKERATGATSDVWEPMTEKDFEPDLLTAGVNLNYWAWRQEDVRFPSVGATTSRDIIMQYEGTLTIPQVSGDSLNFIFADFFLGPQTAGYAAGSVGNTTLAGELLWVQGQRVGVAGSKLDMIVRMNVKNQQNLPARRQPYRRRARSSYWF